MFLLRMVFSGWIGTVPNDGSETPCRRFSMPGDESLGLVHPLSLYLTRAEEKSCRGEIRVSERGTRAEFCVQDGKAIRLSPGAEAESGQSKGARLRRRPLQR